MGKSTRRGTRERLWVGGRVLALGRGDGAVDGVWPIVRADRVAVLYRGKLQGVGDTSRVFNTPESDYTRQLLSAIPGQSAA